MLTHLASSGAVELTEGPARGDPEVSFPEAGGHEEAGFELLRRAVSDSKAEAVPLSGLKDAMRKLDKGFSERAYGYRTFLQFSRAAAARGTVSMEWSDEADDYLVSL